MRDELEEFEDQIETLTDGLNQSINNEFEIEAVLIEELDKHPDIKAGLSSKMKYLRLRQVTESEKIKGLVMDWLKACKDIRVLENRLRQMMGKRDSKKKIYSNVDRVIGGPNG